MKDGGGGRPSYDRGNPSNANRSCVLLWALRPCINSLSPGWRRKTTPKPSGTPPFCRVTVHGRAASAYKGRKAEPFHGSVKCDTIEPEEGMT